MATAGDLDTAFNGTGYYFAPIAAKTAAGFSDPTSMVVEPDGSVVLASPDDGGLGLIRLTPAGKLDPTFGTGGTATFALPSGDTNPTIGTLLLQLDGKLVVTGSLHAGGSTAGAEAQFAARFDADGAPDSTFGSGGLAIIPASTFGDFAGASGGYSALQSNGQIVIVGSASGPNGQDVYEVAATRLDADGSIDTHFGTNGGVTISTVPPSDLGPHTGYAADAVAIEPSGKILLDDTYTSQGEGPSGQYGDTAELHLLNVDGTLDDSALTPTIYGKYGLYSPAPNGLIVEPSGQILFLADSIQQLTTYTSLALLDAGGAVVRSVAVTSPFGHGSGSQSLALQPNGDVVVSIPGGGLSPTDPPGIETSRFLPNLDPDTSFGDAGVSSLTIPVPSGSDPVTNPSGGIVAVGSGGQLFVAGSPMQIGNGGGFYAVAQFVATTTVTPPPPPKVAVPGDFTGDGKADVATYLPSLGAFAIRPSQGGPDQIIAFGQAGAGNTVPAPADYFGTGRDDIAAYLPALGAFAIRNPTTGTDQILGFGIPGPGQTLPAPADYFGTGRDDVAAYLPSLGAFAIRNPTTNADEILAFGAAGQGASIPVPGDYDGSGKDELAVYLVNQGAFAYRPAAGGADVIIPFGIPGAGNTIPVPGDYDGSGRTELGVYLPSLGEFIYRSAITGKDVTLAFGPSGAGQTLPAVADYAGDGRDQVAAYLPGPGEFAEQPPTGPASIVGFGIPGAGQSIPVVGTSPDVFIGLAPTASAQALPAQEVQADAFDFVPDLVSPKRATVG